MTHVRAATSAPKSAPSLFEVYSGYVLTQGRDALENTVLWERLMRFVALVVAAFVVGLWLLAEVEHTRGILLMKLVLSVVLLGICAHLLWRSRVRMQHEVRVDLIRREVSQVMRGADGSERRLLSVGFAEVESLFIRRNRDLAVGSALFMRLRNEETPVLLATGTACVLEAVHARMAADLNTFRGLIDLPDRPMDPMHRPRAMQTA